MSTLIRGLAERRRSLYIVTTRMLLEIERPREAKISAKKVTPEAALFSALGKRATLIVSGNKLKIKTRDIISTVEAEEISTITILRAAAPSLNLAAWAAENLIPGVPYYDIIDQHPELAVPTWAETSKICSHPLFKCLTHAA
ncbi:MAG: hypothetical protein F7C35_08855 [Desulfurococcales archaeon]|nr:hypothetical protein [Desulfurococcales archaeon]